MNRANRVWMFSGQGSQYPCMGLDLYENDPVFKQCLNSLDAIASKHIGESVMRVVYGQSQHDDQPQKFKRLLFTHPALFMIQYAVSQSLLARGVEPDVVIGASLGEFVAAAVAGVATPEDLLVNVIDQAKSIETRCDSGSMLAILYSPNLYFDTPLAHEYCDLVSINYAQHFVVSGDQTSIDQLDEYLKQKSITTFRLDVSYGFHSKAIEPALCKLDERLSKRQTYLSPQLPFFSSCDGGELFDIPNDHFCHMLREPIAFSETVAVIEKTYPHCCYLDLGVSPTLKKFVDETLSVSSTSTSLSIMTPFGNDYQHLLSADSLLADNSTLRHYA